MNQSAVCRLANSPLCRTLVNPSNVVGTAAGQRHHANVFDRSRCRPRHVQSNPPFVAGLLIMTRQPEQAIDP
ncbi:hypothetical protein PS273GM_19640 [Stutzerimonas stutzeri]|jgi:hypothetical protein|uniref:Uncharacterized protein n=1 Tax=Stutzerimonas stutzeri TaxID=316 RepID=A0A172WUR6_STUST|nr:hypothetical protein PS273GM_19640 [Stutzerimonas stutzeri]